MARKSLTILFTVLILSLFNLRSSQYNNRYGVGSGAAAQSDTELAFLSPAAFIGHPQQTSSAMFYPDNVSTEKEIHGHHNSRVISEFDHVIRAVGKKEGHDWRLLCAIAYNESRFIDSVVSPRGARGLMQIMPAVARQFDVPQEEIIKPEVNVTVGAKLLSRIEKSLRISDNTPQEDKMKIILACYNGGIGHVTDARKLASKYGYNPNSWHDVAMFLKLKSEPEYHEDEVVKCGSFRGSGQTISFVDNVMRKYDNYCAIVD